jgi:hypothetical protein
MIITTIISSRIVNPTRLTPRIGELLIRKGIDLLCPRLERPARSLVREKPASSRPKTRLRLAGSARTASDPRPLFEPNRSGIESESDLHRDGEEQAWEAVMARSRS